MSEANYDVLAVEKLAASGTLPEALALAQSILPAGGTLSLRDMVDVALELADEQVAQGLHARAAGTLQAALRLIDSPEHWTEADGLDTRLLAVEVMDRLAVIYLDMGRPRLALAEARAAQDLSEDVEADDSAAQADRALIIARAQAMLGEGDFPMESAEESVGDVETGAPPPPVAAPSAPMKRMPAPEADSVQESPFHTVNVLYATHRDRTGRTNPYDFYRGRREALTFGRASVTVPKDRSPGEFKTANARNYKSADKARLITIDVVEMLGGRDAFLQAVASDVRDSRHKEALIFIHGFNTSFAGAIQRAAALSVDLDIDGATIAYSWPSRGSLLSYFADRAGIVAPILEDLARLIVDIARQSGAEKVHVLAHSMGCQVLIDSLYNILTYPEVTERPLLSEVIFASPDVDLAHFKGRLERIQPLAERVTTYSSREDRALQVSALLQGDRRAGQAAAEVGAAGCDAVDTTEADQDFLGHTDFAMSALDDLRALLWPPRRITPERREAVLEPHDPHTHWLLRALQRRAPDHEAFRDALTSLRAFGPEDALSRAMRAVQAGGDPDAEARLNYLKSLLSLS